MKSDDDTRDENGQEQEDLLADWNPGAESADMPHWTDEPTGQIPAALIRNHSDENAIPAPVWREESADWQAEDEMLDPLLFSPEADVPTSLMGTEPESDDARPWEFDDELPSGGTDEAEPTDSVGGPPERAPWEIDEDEAFAYVPVAPVAPRQRRGRGPEDSDARQERTAAPRRVKADAPQRGGRDMRTAVLTGIIVAVLVLVTFNIGTVLAMLLVAVVVTLAAAEAYAAFRRAGSHPATLLGLAATLALMLGTYNKGTQALGLVFALLFVFTILWFMTGVEKADVVKGLSSTILVFAWVSVLGSFAALLLNPNLFPHRNGLAFLLAAIILVVGYDVSALFVVNDPEVS